jgi:quinol monooxygenase YgiN
MILLRIHLIVPPANRPAVMGAIRMLLEPTRVQKGCLACYGRVDIDDANTIMFIEEWNDQQSLNAHLRSEEFRVLLSALDLAGEAPDVRFDTVTKTEGMEVIRAARRPQEG